FFTTGSGSAAEAFKQLGYSAQDVATKLREPSKFLTEIIGKVQRLDKASQIKIFDQLFGGDGAKFVQLIDQGEQGIRDTIDAAHDMNAVLRDDVIKQAEEIDKQFAIITTTISGWVQPAVIR